MKIKGEFYFNKTNNGNLLGEYTNNGMDCRYDAECANPIEKNNNSFFGSYDTVWLEDESKHSAKLKICQKNNKIRVDWLNKNEKHNF